MKLWKWILGGVILAIVGLIIYVVVHVKSGVSSLAAAFSTIKVVGTPSLSHGISFTDSTISNPTDGAQAQYNFNDATNGASPSNVVATYSASAGHWTISDVPSGMSAGDSFTIAGNQVTPGKHSSLLMSTGVSGNYTWAA